MVLGTASVGRYGPSTVTASTRGAVRSGPLTSSISAISCQGADSPQGGVKWRQDECHMCMNCENACPEDVIKFTFLPNRRSAVTVRQNRFTASVVLIEALGGQIAGSTTSGPAGGDVSERPEMGSLHGQVQRIHREQQGALPATVRRYLAIRRARLSRTAIIGRAHRVSEG